jgi:hypothetical protein
VSKDEFRTMLYSLLTPASELLQHSPRAFAAASALAADDEAVPSAPSAAVAAGAVSASLRDLGGSVRVVEGNVETHSTVEQLVARIFNGCDADLDARGGLDFVAFKKFIAQTPEVIQMMESVMARHAWTPLDAREHEQAAAAETVRGGGEG